MSDTDTGSVSYTIKELLGKLDGKIDVIILTLSGKADKGDLVEVERRVSSLEREVVLQEKVNEALRKENGQTWSVREKVLGALLAFGALAIQLYAQFGG